MSLQELENAVAQLPNDELATFARWFEEYMADEWDRQIESDINSGKLDPAGKRATEHFDGGRCTPL